VGGCGGGWGGGGVVGGGVSDVGCWCMPYKYFVCNVFLSGNLEF